MKKTILFLAFVLAVISCRPEASSNHPEWTAGTTVYEMNVRQITPEGTFAAAAGQLMRLKESGIDIVWLMPVHPIGELERKGTLGSYYAPRNYYEINPEFGTLEDFDAFVAEAHSLGMKVILDWVANHTSPDSDWAENHPDWFLRDENGKFIVQHDWTDIAPLDLSNKEMRAAMRDCLRFWLKRGVDGFRCDVAGEMPVEYWEEQLSILRKEFPDRYWLAEGEKQELHKAGFDATYSWELHHMLNGIDEGELSAEDLVKYIQKNDEYYPEDAYRLTFITNHDENAWAGTVRERLSDAWKAACVLCWTLPKSQPLTYTGQLVGMDHRFQFFEKDTMPSDDWNATSDFYRQLNRIYHDNPALWPASGSSFELISSEGNTLKFRRSLKDNSVEVSVCLDAPWTYEIKTSSDRIERIEPLSWWVGMKTPLQLMVKGKDIGTYDLHFEDAPGIIVSQVHKAENPDYIFADVKLGPKAVPGTYMLVFEGNGERFSIPYEFAERRKGSAERQSFDTSDAIYLIMPDRFSNGDPTNDNSPETAEKADYEAFFGRHGGDIQGILNHLDYISGLGMTAIWSTPLLLDNEPRESYHGYACADYYQIDPRFGSNASYKALVREAHGKGLKMIMDVVTNHCGAAHWWMSSLPFSDWIHQWPEYTHSNCAFSAQNDPYCSEFDRKNMVGGWFDTAMPDMNLENPYVLQYFKQWAVWWIEWADLDGFRVDTYPYNDKLPMAEWCKAVRNEYPGINIVGEVWSENVPQVAYWQADNPNRDGFNSNLPSIMDFPLYGAITRGINADWSGWDGGMVKVYDSIANDVYYKDTRNIMIFPGNHDTERIADIVNGDSDRLKIVMTLMATLRGYPQIFAGDELGLHSRDRSQGHGGLRVEFPDNWESDSAVKELHDYVSTLLRWRRTSDAVKYGATLHFLERNNSYAYFRHTEGDVVFVFVNNNPEPMTVPWQNYAEITSKYAGRAWKNVVSGEIADPGNLVARPKSGIVLQLVPAGSGN